MKRITRSTAFKCNPIAGVIFALVFAGCGGSGGSSDPRSDGMNGPLAVNATNAADVAVVGASLAESFVQISLSAMENVFDLSDARLEPSPLSCLSGDGMATATDNDSSVSLTAGDIVNIDYANCFQESLGSAVSGRISVQIVSLIINSNLSVSGEANISIPTSIQFDPENGITTFVSGTFTVRFTRTTMVENLLVSTSTNQSVEVRFTDSTTDATETAENVSILRKFDTSDIYTIDYALSIDSQSNGGTFDCATASVLSGAFGFLPEAGVLQCTGAGNSAVRVVTVGSNDVDVYVDAEGDGTFVDAGLPSNGNGSWEDFIEGQLVGTKLDTPGGSRGSAIPQIGSNSLSIAINDIVFNEVNGQLYASTDTDISEIDPNTLLVRRSTALTNRPGPLSISDDGSTLWIGFEDVSEFTSVDTDTLAEGARVHLGTSPGPTTERFVQSIRVAPGTVDTVVVTMRGAREMMAFKSGVQLPNMISADDVPTKFEFRDEDSIVGINDTSSLSFAATLVKLDAGGLVLEKVLDRYGDSFLADLALRGGEGVLNNGRVFNVADEVIVGKFDLSQSGSATRRDAVYVDASADVVYFYDAFDDLIDFYDASRMVLLGEYRLRTDGDVIDILETTNDQIVLVLDTGIHAIDKLDLDPNRLSDPCLTTDLSGQLGPTFFIQTTCRFNDAVYDESRGLIYASLASAAGPRGNSVVVVDPVTGLMQSHIFVGSEPTRLAITASGNRLYVALGATSMVAVVDLATNTLLPSIRLQPSVQVPRPQFGTAIAASPASEVDVIVATEFEASLYVSGDQATGVAVGAGGSGRPDVFFSSDGSRAYTVAAGLRTFDVDVGGLSSVRLDLTVLQSAGVRQKGDLLFDRRGVIYDPVAFASVATCPISLSSAVSPDPDSDIVYYLDAVFDSVLFVCDTVSNLVGSSFNVPLFGGPILSVKSIFPAGPNRFVITAGERMLFLDPVEF